MPTVPTRFIQITGAGDTLFALDDVGIVWMYVFNGLGRLGEGGSWVQLSTTKEG
jgi:hypothetical protein